MQKQLLDQIGELYYQLEIDCIYGVILILYDFHCSKQKFTIPLQFCYYFTRWNIDDRFTVAYQPIRVAWIIIKFPCD